MNALLPILIVEDDEATAALEQRVLTRAGRTSITVHRVADAVEMLRADSYAAVLLDYNLPDGDPWSVVEVAQARVPRVPVIVVTAAGNERIAAEALHHGVAEYLQKTDAFWNQLPDLISRVTTQAQAEERVRRSDSLFRLIAESATDLVVSTSLEGVIQEVSAACVPMLGYEREELIGRPVWHYVHADDRERLVNALRAKSHMRLSYRQIKRDGTPLWVEVNASVVRDPTTGRAREFVGIIRDIHERKRAEDKFRALLEGGPEANVIVDRNGDIALVNSRVAALFGYEREELLGRPFEMLIAERFRKPGFQPAAMAGPFETGARRKDGSEFPCEISVNPLETEGELLVSTTILDISDRKTLQDQHMLLQLGEKLPHFDDVRGLVGYVCEALSNYFDVPQCMFSEMDLKRGVSIVHGEYHRTGPSFIGEHSISEFAPAIRHELESARVVSIPDLSTDLRTAEAYPQRYAPIGIRALAAVPLLRKGRWAANFFVMDERPRRWMAREIQMLQALVERTWLWIEHVRMVRALRDSERKYRHFIESTHEGVWEIDNTTRTVFVNPRMAQMLGYTPDEMIGRVMNDFLDDEGRKMVAEQVERRKAGISESHDSKFLRKDGRGLWVRLETNPLMDDTGKFIGALAMVADNTERHQAEKDQQFLLALAEVLTVANDPAVARRDAVTRLGSHLSVQHCDFAEFEQGTERVSIAEAWSADSVPQLSAEHALAAFGGVPAELSQGRSLVINDVDVDERMRPHARAAFAAIGARAVLVVPMHKQGKLSAVLALISDRPRVWGQREISLAQSTLERTSLCVERLQNYSALQDMSKELERRVDSRTRELKAALTEKEVLLKEIHHRVKNNLQVISSMLNLQAMHIKDEASQAVFAESQGRVQSIALVHETLYESQDLSSVNFAEYIHTLVTTVLQAQMTPDRNISTMIDSDGVLLPVGCAIPCGLIINELVTNSLKHAFKNRDSGVIRVSLHMREQNRVELAVADDGIGLAPDLDPRKLTSLGLDLVYTFAEQLGAQVELLRQNGTEFRFNFAVQEDP